MTDGAPPSDPIDSAPTPPATPPPSKPWYRRPGGILAIVAALLAYPVAKIAIGFVAVSLVGSAVTGVFGSQWDRMPDDVQNRLESRLEAAYGSTLDDLSDEAASAQVEADVRAGLVRTDDETLIKRLTLFTSALNKLELSDCGAFARSSIAGEVPAESAVEHLQAALDGTEFQAWAEISVTAIEAERADSPAPRSIPEDTQTTAFEQMIDTLTAEEFANVQAVVSDPSASDEDACAAVRTFYTASLAMDHDTLAVIAFADIDQAP